MSDTLYFYLCMCTRHVFAGSMEKFMLILMHWCVPGSLPVPSQRSLSLRLHRDNRGWMERKDEKKRDRQIVVERGHAPPTIPQGHVGIGWGLDIFGSHT